MKAQLQELAVKIRDWQQVRGISDAELCKRFKGLPSTKTYKRILNGDFEELDVDKWHLQYSQVWGIMEVEANASPIEEPIYDDLDHVVMAQMAVESAVREKGNNRLVILEGPTGAGKSTAARELRKKYGSEIVMAEADETWAQDIGAMLDGLLAAMGHGAPRSRHRRLEELIGHLKVRPIVIVIDDAHHFGPKNLNVCKTLINRTLCRIVLVAMETLFQRLESTNYEEARQLTKNRMCERVKLRSPEQREVEKFLSRRGIHFEDGQFKAAAKVLAAESSRQGNWNFVNMVARETRFMCGKEPCDTETFAKAMQKVLATR